MSLILKDLAIGYNKTPIVDKINMNLESGKVLAVLGANGSGKTTLFRTIMGLINPLCGSVMVCGKDVFAADRKKLGKLMAYVPQSHSCTFSYSVLDVVIMGRNPFLKPYEEPGDRDYKIVKNTLKSLNIYHLAERRFKKLSGGERKLVLIARALVQQPQLIVMDEPTSDLDIKNTIVILEQISSLKDKRINIIITTHSPKEARVYADKILMLKNGKVHAFGDVDILDNTAMIKSLYNLESISTNHKISRYLNEIA